MSECECGRGRINERKGKELVDMGNEKMHACIK